VFIGLAVAYINFARLQRGDEWSVASEYSELAVHARQPHRLDGAVKNFAFGRYDLKIEFSSHLV